MTRSNYKNNFSKDKNFYRLQTKRQSIFFCHKIGRNLTINTNIFLYDKENLPIIAEEDYSKIISEIIRKFPECYINPEYRNIAPDHLKEYTATIYREFRKNNRPEEFFSYSGWGLVGGKPVYLSDSRNDCKCDMIVPKILPEEHQKIWQEDLNILSVQKKTYAPDVTFNDLNSLNVILPFWLYLHLGYACKLFWDAGLKVQFILLLVGKTGSLKTTLCETFAEPFNEGTMLRFESTAVALENYREECIDMTMVVDDIFKKDSSSMKNCRLSIEFSATVSAGQNRPARTTKKFLGQKSEAVAL